MHPPTNHLSAEQHYATPCPSPLQPSYFPSDRQFPLYAQPNTLRPRRASRHRSYTARRLPPRCNDIRTGERRPRLKQRRSSFALSDAFERDSGVEFVVSPMLPSMSTTSISSTTSSVRSRMKAVLLDLVHTVKDKWNRSVPSLHISEPED
ncbi:hypothetical protein BD309DRAFT_945723 [Dichomitus squalens]|uniref:Uncharacterized protein n=1 Tax=Dichomitus squalens TaxID=114155 RepID=A0A4Q9QCE7_9APHY|nr:hypothetical protein BD309DRAFT_945723 [Dichomitus squalens]TBU65369.1 hypothetical protein BD310DRAFT_911237 [Dichomitus squalens]